MDKVLRKRVIEVAKLNGAHAGNGGICICALDRLVVALLSGGG